MANKHKLAALRKMQQVSFNDSPGDDEFEIEVPNDAPIRVKRGVAGAIQAYDPDGVEVVEPPYAYQDEQGRVVTSEPSIVAEKSRDPEWKKKNIVIPANQYKQVFNKWMSEGPVYRGEDPADVIKQRPTVDDDAINLVSPYESLAPGFGGDSRYEALSGIIDQKPRKKTGKK